MCCERVRVAFVSFGTFVRRNSRGFVQGGNVRSLVFLIRRYAACLCSDAVISLVRFKNPVWVSVIISLALFILDGGCKLC